MRDDFDAQWHELAEEPRQNLYRMHRDPVKAAHRLVTQHATRRAERASHPAAPPP